MFDWTLWKWLPVELWAKYIILVRARVHRHCFYASKQLWAQWFCTGFSCGRIDFKNNLKHCPRSETALVPKLSPFTQLLLIKQRKPFNPSPSLQKALFSSFFLLVFLSRWGPLSHFQQRTILKVYQQLLVNPLLLLCALFSGFSFLLPPPRGPLERRALSWPCGEKMAEFIPCCVGDNTPECDTSRLRLQAEDSFLAFSLSPRLQCRH